MSNSFDSPSGERTFALVPLYISPITDTILFGIPYAARILSILPRCTVSKAFLKLINVGTAAQQVICRFSHFQLFILLKSEMKVLPAQKPLNLTPNSPVKTLLMAHLHSNSCPLLLSSVLMPPCINKNMKYTIT